MKQIEFRRKHYGFDNNLIDTTYWGKVDGGFLSPSSHSSEDKSKVVDELFSGILDKNQKKIFEGDNVKLWLDFYGAKDEYFGTVVFKDCAFFVDDIKDVKYKEPKCQYKPHNSMLLSSPEFFEIISKEYICNYGEVYKFSENTKYLEII